MPESAGSPSRAPYACDPDDAVYFDLECSPGRWLVGFYGPDERGVMTVFQVDGDVDLLRRVLDRLTRQGKTLFGYN